MRGIYLKQSLEMFGPGGFKFWFRWSFIDPVQIWIWLNITHKSYCTYSGWHCNTPDCRHEHLLTKKEIVTHWDEAVVEMQIVEEGKDGKCVYCGEEAGTETVPNPNLDKFNQWLVCKDCKEIIQYQQQLTFATLVNDEEGINEANEKLLEISKRTGKKIFCGTIDKDAGISSVTYTGEKK